MPSHATTSHTSTPATQPDPDTHDPTLMAKAEARAGEEATLPLTSTMIDHICMNPMLHAKLRGVSLGASHAGVCNYHLAIIARIALRRALPSIVSTGRARDFRRVRPQLVKRGDRIVELPARVYAQETMDMEIMGLCRTLESELPLDRLSAIAQRAQDIYDACLPTPPSNLWVNGSARASHDTSLCAVL